ncbi:lipid-A-disaccharide synthase [Striga asiatica]|uniref:Lipid-A-disaccharide synthase n=1 Tax=Striga asiatica TaxID=4170 RepID=A0A5A7R810_STRAF|nr:lipid-A-disaccharide synthase [Striga asiatica]
MNYSRGPSRRVNPSGRSKKGWCLLDGSTRDQAAANFDSFEASSGFDRSKRSSQQPKGIASRARLHSREFVRRERPEKRFPPKSRVQRLESREKSKSIGPESELFLKSSTSSFEQSAKVEGTEPENKFECTSRCSSRVKFSNTSGKGPENRLPERIRVLRLVSLPIFGLIWPEKLFVETESTSKEEIEYNDSENSPEKEFESITSCWREALLQLLYNPSSPPVNPLDDISRTRIFSKKLQFSEPSCPANKLLLMFNATRFEKLQKSLKFPVNEFPEMLSERIDFKPVIRSTAGPNSLLENPEGKSPSKELCERSINFKPSNLITVSGNFPFKSFPERFNMVTRATADLPALLLVSQTMPSHSQQLSDIFDQENLIEPLINWLANSFSADRSFG